MLCLEVSKYIERSKGLPFFYAVGDKEYINVLSELKYNGLEVIRTSKFCHTDDKFPDIDEMVDCFRTLDVDFKSNKFVLVGLGEYLALRGAEETKHTLRRIKNITLGNARVIILLRGITNHVKDLLNEDNRIMAKKLAYISEDWATNISITNNKIMPSMEWKRGIKHLIYALEDGVDGNVVMYSTLSFEESLFPIVTVDKAFSALSKAYKDVTFLEQYGSDEQWVMLLEKASQNSDYFKKYFSYYINYEDDIYEHIRDNGYQNWLYFLNLKLYHDKIQNKYLSYVVNVTDQAEELKYNILVEITKIPHTDKGFKELYNGRKTLVKNFSETDIAIFIDENRVDSSEEIYRYTDNTTLERKQIISWIANNGWNDVLEEIYPDLGMYLKKYIFDCGSISEQLTDYFAKYKLLKVENRINDEFMDLVLDYGKKCLYTKLQTRDMAINKIENKCSTYLYWIDALGVEYLSYIVGLANKKGLSIHVDVARAELPTITSINRGFYENWSGAKKYKEEELDDTKHKKKGGFFYTEEKIPFHLVAELDIIKRAIDVAATTLAMRKCKQFVLASDHGASRLAVIKKDENSHPTDTQGEHSGRCCKAYDESNREFVIEENGYFVRTDYGRYKGSREANVEVHGGASLEEVVIPIITLKLKKQTDVDIRIQNTLQADRHKGTIVELYISDVVNVGNVYLVVDGNKYDAQSKDGMHYSILVEHIRRQKECRAEVYDGDDLIGTIELVVKGKTASINNDFDNLF